MKNFIPRLQQAFQNRPKINLKLPSTSGAPGKSPVLSNLMKFLNEVFSTIGELWKHLQGRGGAAHGQSEGGLQGLQPGSLKALRRKVESESGNLQGKWPQVKLGEVSHSSVNLGVPSAETSGGGALSKLIQPFQSSLSEIGAKLRRTSQSNTPLHIPNLAAGGSLLGGKPLPSGGKPAPFPKLTIAQLAQASVPPLAKTEIPGAVAFGESKAIGKSLLGGGDDGHGKSILDAVKEATTHLKDIKGLLRDKGRDGGGSYSPPDRTIKHKPHSFGQRGE